MSGRQRERCPLIGDFAGQPPIGAATSLDLRQRVFKAWCRVEAPMADLAVNSAAVDSSLGGAKALRIGLIGPLPPPAGGMATQCQQLHELLRREALSVVLVQTNPPYRPRCIEAVRGLRALFRLVPYLISLKRLCGRVDVIHLLANSGWAWHLLAAPAIWIARWQRVPIIVNYRGGDADRFLQSAPSWVNATLRAAQACVVPSGFLRQVLQRHGVATTVIPNVVDLDVFKPRQGPRLDGVMHIVITRNLEAIYAIDYALRAFAIVAARYENVRLTVAGEGPQRDLLTALAHELGIAGKVRFVGRLARGEIAELYRDAGIMLNPSTIDNMPNSILEAYASGVPVVSTDVGGIPFMARDGETALLVPPRDVEAMAKNMGRLISDRALAQRLAHNGLQEVFQYRWSEVGAEWMRLYTRLCAPDNLAAERR